MDALGASIVQELVSIDPNIEVLYQSWKDEPVDIHFGSETVRCQPLVIRRRSSLRRQDGINQLRRLSRLASALGPSLGERLATCSTTLRQLLGCDAVLDISAGDSFSDIYGETIFDYQADVKRLCLDLGVPLVLLPQTIGPFDAERVRDTAADLISRCSLVATREAEGIAELRELCGKSLPDRIVQSPDVAFVLGPTPTPLPEAAEAHLANGAGPLISVNLSGLLHFGKAGFSLAADQADLAMRLVRWALSIENARVLLTPHVVPSPDSPRSGSSPTADSTDVRACRDVMQRLEPEEAQRVDLLTGATTPARAKHAMSRCDFFVGARMHAFIGAASLTTPGALLAYSKKADGVTSLIGVADAVVDLRSTTADDVIASVDELYHRRDELRSRLAEYVPDVKSRVRGFFARELAPTLGVEVEAPPAPGHPAAAMV